MSILRDRNIRKSVMAKSRELLSSGSSGLNAYNVYNEKQMREVQQQTFTPIPPFVFVVDSTTRPTDTTLPMVIVEIPRKRRRPFELGNRSGRRTEAILHVFGRQQGERDDLASFFVDNWGGTFPIYDYSSGSTAFVENAELEDQIDVEEFPLKRDDMRWEASLDYWTMVSFAFWTRN